MDISTLALLANISPVTVQRWLSGEYEPRNKNLRAIAHVLNTSSSYLNGEVNWFSVCIVILNFRGCCSEKPYFHCTNPAFLLLCNWLFIHFPRACHRQRGYFIFLWNTFRMSCLSPSESVNDIFRCSALSLHQSDYGLCATPILPASHW